MKKLLTVLAVAMTAVANIAMAGTMLQYLNLDTGASAVTEGDDLFPYVCDQEGNDLRGTQNAGFLRIGKGKTSYINLDTSVKTPDEELTVEFFIKGGSDGVKAWDWLFSLGGTWGGAKQSIVVDANGSNKIRLRVASVAGGIDAASKETSVSLTDGIWHHVAVTIKPINDGAGSHINGYVDYAKVIDKDLPSPYLYAATDNCLDLNRSGGGNNANSSVDFDEVRFTRGVLDPKDFLHLEGKPPVDGETLLYLPLDGEAKTIAHVERQGKIDGTFSFADTTRTRTAVKGYGSEVRIRQLNLKYCAPGALSSSYNNYWALSKEKCQTCTIEFFIKGSADVTPWQTSFCYGTWTSLGNYGFLVQVNSDKTIWLKPGVGNSDTGFKIPADLTKERWHHVALTIQPSTKEGCENGSHIEAFLDYNTTPVAANDYKNAFNGLPSGRLCFNPNGSAHCSIDELRVTKGILPVSKFLSFEKLGLILTVQ